MEPRATTAAGPLTKTGTVHAHPLTLCNPRKFYPGFGGRWNCGYCNEEQRDGRMWHCGQAGCAFDACEMCVTCVTFQRACHGARWRRLSRRLNVKQS
eukprot:5894016-Prymnesium_polylepis.1